MKDLLAGRQIKKTTSVRTNGSLPARFPNYTVLGKWEIGLNQTSKHRKKQEKKNNNKIEKKVSLAKIFVFGFGGIADHECLAFN